MRLRGCGTAVAIAVVAPGMLTGTAAAQAPDLAAYTRGEDVAARLEAGEDAESSLVMFLADVPEAAAWSVFTGYESQPEFMPHMTRVEVERGTRETRVCFEYDILWVDSTNCFLVEARRDAGTLVGRLDPQRSDDRLHGARYFWHVRPWRGDDRLLLAYYQQISYSGVLTALGHEAFVGPTRTAEAVRERLRDLVSSARLRPPGSRRSASSR